MRCTWVTQETILAIEERREFDDLIDNLSRASNCVSHFCSSKTQIVVYKWSGKVKERETAIKSFKVRLIERPTWPLL